MKYQSPSQLKALPRFVFQTSQSLAIGLNIDLGFDSCVEQALLYSGIPSKSQAQQLASYYTLTAEIGGAEIDL